MRVTVEGADLDLGDLQIIPGLINAHDHLHFALFPRLGSGPYPNATAWARDIYHPARNPIRQHLRVPKHLRLIWGGLRNLLCGVTTVSHHDAWHPVFAEDFPVRVVKRYGWAHSLTFTPHVRANFDATPPGAPFLIHLGEGTDAEAAGEIFRLREIGALDRRTVLIHAVAVNGDGWNLAQRTGAAAIWCPRSNLSTLGKTLDPAAIDPETPLALGTDSPLTSEGDLLDEICFVLHLGIQASDVCQLVGLAATRILRLPERPHDWIAAPAFGQPPELVVIGGRILLIGARLARSLPAPLRVQFFEIGLDGRPTVRVRCNVPQLLRQTREFLQCSQVRLGGRRVEA
jgi:hypothetical protein